MRCLRVPVSSLLFLAFVPTASAQYNKLAPLTIKKRVVTGSGDAEMLFADGLSTTRAKLAGLCQKIGWAPRTNAGDPRRLTCDVPSTERTTVAIRPVHNLVELAESDPMFVVVRKQVTFYLTPERGGTLARAQAARFYPSPDRGRPTEVAIGDENTFNGLINIMALVGGRFAPGTHFRKQAYIGFQSDSVLDRTTESGKRVALSIGAIDSPSPAAEAGLKVGDLVYAINGHDFENYESAAKIMAKLKQGDAVTLQFERGKMPIEVSLITTAPPTIR